jgi:hypothetical protein
MKWLGLLALFGLLSACGTVTRTQIVEYREVSIAPVVNEVTIIDDEDPVDMTTTTIEYY